MLIRKILHDLYIAFIKIAVKFTPGSKYMLYAGEGSSRQLCRHISSMGQRKVLIVTDRPLLELGIVERATGGLEDSGMQTALYADVEPDPSYRVVAAGAAVYRGEGCDAILAIGGGSSIDAAKVIGVAVTNPGDPKDYVGFNKVKQALPPLYVIPTTSGTGSEATSGAVITDEETHQKGIISGDGLLPVAACLDPGLLTGLPPHITAATGMDALTHAVEAYIGVWDRGDANAKAGRAAQLIFQHLRTAVADGKSLVAREAMALASYFAGQAINQVNVGNVHAIAHQLGAMYGVPHGLANAMVLPHVLEISLGSARQRLQQLAELCGYSNPETLIAEIIALNADIGVPAKLDALQQADFAEIIRRACSEAFDYPSPHFMSKEDVKVILNKLL